jgi:hypothetical protein
MKNTDLSVAPSNLWIPITPLHGMPIGRAINTMRFAQTSNPRRFWGSQKTFRGSLAGERKCSLRSVSRWRALFWLFEVHQTVHNCTRACPVCQFWFNEEDSKPVMRKCENVELNRKTLAMVVEWIADSAIRSRWGGESWRNVPTLCRVSCLNGRPTTV